MTKDVPPASLLPTPMRENLDRLYAASRNANAALVEIANHRFAFCQRAVFDVLTEMNSLSHVHNPAEFFAVNAQFTRKQVERLIQAWQDYYTDLHTGWLQALTPPRD